MSQLTPCPECQRHVRTTETVCPFCSAKVSLADVPARRMPSVRLGRAATFAFGASVVGAAVLVGCSGDDDDNGGAVAVYGGPPVAGAGGTSPQPSEGGVGGTEAELGGTSGSAGSAVYGAPPNQGDAGAGGQEVGGSGPVNSGGEGGSIAIYGGPPP